MHSKKTDQIIDIPPAFSGQFTNDMVVFKSFRDKADALDLAKILEEEKIVFSVVDNNYSVDLTFAGNEAQGNFQIFLRQGDFERAILAQDKHAGELLQNIEPDHYLFSFSDTELINILAHRDEWSSLDYVLAKKILKDRGLEINEPEIKILHENRMAELSTPERGPEWQLAAGYIFALLGGWIGLMIGWYLWQLKRTLPNGQRIFAYTEHQRKHGKNITLISFVTVPLYTTWMLVSEFFFWS